jgi:hypothetical protein
MKQCYYKDPFFFGSYNRVSLIFLFEIVLVLFARFCTNALKLCTRASSGSVRPHFVICDLDSSGLHSECPKYFYFDIPYIFICFGALIWIEHG